MSLSSRGVTVLIVTASLAVSACAGGHRPRPAPHSAGLARSPCRGIDPWTDGPVRRCSAIVSRVVSVRSMRLTSRVSRRVRRTCDEARRQVRMNVVCPPLVPTDGVVSSPELYGAEGALTSGSAHDFYLVTFNNGENAGHVHWMAGAGRARAVQRNLFDPRIWEVPGRVRRLDERRYGRWVISFYRFPPYPSGGQLGGHDLALARQGGTTYFVSVHGRAHHDADAAMLIAVLLTADERQP